MQLFSELVPFLVVVIAAGLVLAMIFFAAIQRRVSTLAKALLSNQASQQAEAAELTNAINALKRRILELEKVELPNRTSVQSEPDLNSAVRSTAFKLQRAGQPSDTIAQKLGLSKGEVELLIKAQKIVMRPYENAEITAAGGAEKS
jgi:response regulator RpfG family c-di-GMP phosphodiesterase